ncbi:hypothetical protein Tco_0110911 [Tanacetum coccineum]
MNVIMMGMIDYRWRKVDDRDDYDGGLKDGDWMILVVAIEDGYQLKVGWLSKTAGVIGLARDTGAKGLSGRGKQPKGAFGIRETTKGVFGWLPSPHGLCSFDATTPFVAAIYGAYEDSDGRVTMVIGS